MNQLLLQKWKCIYVEAFRRFHSTTCIYRLSTVRNRVDCGKQCCQVYRYFQSDAKSSVNEEEMKRFQQLSADWLLEESSFKSLYSLNKLRVPWIVKALSTCNYKHGEYPLRGRRIVDVACGGGILSVALARLGACVSAIDASPEAVQSTKQVIDVLLKRNTVGSVTVQHSTVEDFAKEHANNFDAVVASEVIEHVNNLDVFLKSCIDLGRNNALIFITTINKTILSKIFAIHFAEDILRIVPSGVHDWAKFVKPNNLHELFEKNSCRVCFTHGLSYNPFTNKWTWCNNPAVNYAMMARKLDNFS